ncbi:MAG: protein kinase [Actinomycetota bacterium]|nr:protein kinase [Actinomycetota bacterium]
MADVPGTPPTPPSAQRPSAGARYLAGRYRLDSIIGKGAMGTVWRAYDEVVHRLVAIKEINLPSGMPTGEVELVADRTMREARAIGALSHAHVITLYDILTVDGRPYIVMELLQARSLAQVLRQDGPLRDGVAATIGVAVAGALLAAHQAGITHRDVKPGNVLVGNDGRVKLTDFGIARSADEPSMTMTGLLLGSPAYIAPEVAAGGLASPASDAWGLGAMLFATVEGRPPFDRGDAIATLTAVVANPVPPHPHAGRLGPVIDGLLVKSPAARMTVAQARDQLKQYADDPTGITANVARPPRSTEPAGAPAVSGGGPAGPGGGPAGARQSRSFGDINADVPLFAPRRSDPVPPPPWANSGSKALSPLPVVAERRSRPVWVLPVVALIVVAMAVGGFFGVRLLADLGQQSATAGSTAPRIVRTPPERPSTGPAGRSAQPDGAASGVSPSNVGSQSGTEPAGSDSPPVQSAVPSTLTGKPLDASSGFVSPSHNIWCRIDETGAVCRINVIHYDTPSCNTEKPVAVARLPVHGHASMTGCPGDLLANATKITAPYGSLVSGPGGVNCNMASDGVRCVNPVGGSFRLSAERFDHS